MHSKTAAAFVKVEGPCNNKVLRIKRPQSLSLFLLAVSLPVVTFTQIKSNRGGFQSYHDISGKISKIKSSCWLCKIMPAATKKKDSQLPGCLFPTIERVTWQTL